MTDTHVPALVFVHGFLGSLNDWADLPRRIAPDRWHVLLELPGHGDEVDAATETFALEGCVKALLAQIHASAIERFVLIGYSMGGRIGLHAALAAGSACVGAVIESAGVGLSDETERTARREHDEQWARRFEHEPMERVLADWYRQPVFASLAGKPELVKKLVERRRHNDPAGIARALRGLGAGVVPSLVGRQGNFTMPVLFVAGAEDPKYATALQQAAGLFPKGAAVIVPGSGHSVHAENPDGFCEVVREFLSQCG